MSKDYVRKLQNHGTGKEMRVPPEVCEKLGIDGGDDVSFGIDLNNEVVTLTKDGAQPRPKPERHIKAVALDQGRKKVISLIDTENTIALNFVGPVCVISGPAGSDKRHFAEKLCRYRKQLVVYDTPGEYNGGVLISDLQSLKYFLAKVSQGRFRIIYRPVNPEDQFDPICELIDEHKPLTFLVDGLDLLCESPATRQFEKLIDNAHTLQVELIATAQRPEKIAELLDSQFEQRYQLIQLPTQTDVIANSAESL